MLPVTMTTIHIMNSNGIPSPFRTIWEKMLAGIARMMRKNTDTRFSGPPAGRMVRTGYSTSSSEKGG